MRMLSRSMLALRILLSTTATNRWYLWCLCALLLAATFGVAVEQARATTTDSSTPITASSSVEAATSTTEAPATNTPATEPQVTASNPAGINQTRVVNLAANISNQQEAMLGRLTQIHSRLVRRLDKAGTAGTDVTAARETAAEALANLEAARRTLNDIDVQIAGFVTAAEPAAVWPEVKATYQTSNQSLQVAFAALKLSAEYITNPPAETTATSSATIEVET